MPSEAARARALQRGPGAWGFLLAHHGPKNLERCYRFWIANRPFWLCARCLGVYPMLAVVFVMQCAIPVPEGWWDIPWLFLLPIPALVDWGLARLGRRTGSNPGRTITGAVLGLSLGRSIYLNMIRPARALVVWHFGMLVAVVVLLETWARWRSARQAGQDLRDGP